MTDLSVSNGAAAALVPPPDREEIWLQPPRHRIERRSVGWWLVRGALTVAVVVGALVAAYVLAEPARPWVGPVLIGASVLGVAHLAVVPLWRYAVHRWEATEEAVYVRSGWFVREWRVAPISRIQTVDTVRGPLQQLFGLATVAVTTASAHGAIYLVGLDHRVAADLTTELTRITQATPGDAT
ncbi:hypothetical protein FHR81_000854 [Actinoalloteichus hoggarensis]|uniref:Bacterial membrane flanked domain protein n=1 Tax=Actinoalloteichus hoggarensis TaxID=1470176 RepID=A0A221W165_9PSEU|nr:PH domain-containing protein [Actinoalloteichus hoggarensis]ASO19470.1 Bacterial membrane flanked domain protein [Actinoalloteichus hoggarensis]MBB5919825.1 hypothetical protein [Actinoalloteichus hoggarensis]